MFRAMLVYSCLFFAGSNLVRRDAVDHAALPRLSRRVWCSLNLFNRYGRCRSTVGDELHFTGMEGLPWRCERWQNEPNLTGMTGPIRRCERWQNVLNLTGMRGPI
ncbi:hypothetical protein BDZ91DRAFT_531033 [Kalaharituber pfeilii]|nr:hypothetical protein BDZ91DRAFT_531033 [Kalaharituber pfeilii]